MNFTITAKSTFDIASLEGFRLSVVGRKIADLASPQGGNRFPPARICSSSGRETMGVGSTGTVGSSVTVGKACEPRIAKLVLHGFMRVSELQPQADDWHNAAVAAERSHWANSDQKFGQLEKPLGTAKWA